MSGWNKPRGFFFGTREKVGFEEVRSYGLQLETECNAAKMSTAEGND